MKTTMIVLTTAALLLVGCGKDEQPDIVPPQPASTADTEPAEATSTTQTVVEGVTGAGVIRKGEEIKETLRNISEDRQRQMEELEDF
jgi:hypothetical protein